MSDDDNRELTITRVFNAPREKVFKAWTDPSLVAKWWGPEGVTNPTCEWDAQPGGAIDVVMLAGEELGDLQGSKWPMKGVFQEVTSPEKLVYSSSAIMEGKPILDCLNTVTFEEDDAGTKMTLHIVVTKVTPEAEGPLAGMKMGWTQSIDKLARLLEK
ncbi:MAG TPA: SRPBCC domain-containing protein [Candidatus Saccharimonadales bacterium]|nr:SRPBCC domain-containing protein [Candidatus Saccharimonadales bacterium]